MGRLAFAVWKPISGGAGPFKGGPPKVVWHKTQSDGAQAAFSAYKANRSDPHFTVAPDFIYQHVDTGEAARALRNRDGGVHTNFDGAIQIEVVGHSGRTAPRATLDNCVRLAKALGVPWHWPAGRPPKTADDGYGEANGDRHAALWDSTGGHYGHSQVPENTHWDPAWTDEEWQYLTTALAPPAPAVEGDSEVAEIAQDVVMNPDGSGRGYVLDCRGGIHPLNGAPQVTASAYWSGDVCPARELVITKWAEPVQGYVLDARGGLHPVGGAPKVSGPYWADGPIN